MLCIVALFLLLGGFGTGGPLPVGMFKGVVGFVLVAASNYVVKKLGHEGIY